jgi:CARDB protein
LPGLAFLDEEQEDLVVQDEPPRPRRRVGGPQRRRQQFLARRLIGVGVGLAFLILIVIGFRGCLEARSDRGLRNYASDIGTIMQQSEQSGKDFFEVLNSPSGGSSLDVKNQVLAQRDASQNLLDRAHDVNVPGQMHDAQSAVTLALKLRADALGVIATNVGQATASAQTGDAIAKISDEMGSLYASDVLWTQIGAPDIKDVLSDENVDAPAIPAGKFMPDNATDFLDQTTLVEKLNGIVGTPTTGGSHGLGLLQTSIGDTTLTADSTTTVPSDAQEIEIQVQNQGDSDESGIDVVVTINGDELDGTIQALDAGEADTLKIPLTTKPQPGTDTNVEVVVQPVPGEQVTDNNQATYTVVFGTG